MSLSSKKLDFHCYSHHIEPYIYYLFSINISISLPSYVNPWCNATLVYYRQFYTCPSKSHQLPPDQLKHTTHSSIKSIFLHLISDLICPAPQASLWALLLDVVALSPLLSSIPHFTSVSTSLSPTSPAVLLSSTPAMGWKLSHMFTPHPIPFCPRWPKTLFSSSRFKHSLWRYERAVCRPSNACVCTCN